MEFKQLQSFAAVVEYESFTKAAEHLYISQPTISTHIRMLEEEFHSSLIIRTTKSLEVTPRGRELYEYARQVIAGRDNLLRRFTKENQNILQIGTSTIPSAYILPEILPDYRMRYPKIQLHIHQTHSQGVLEGLRNDTFEVGMVGMKEQEERFVFLPFYQDSMVLITPAKDPYLQLQGQPELPIGQLLEQPFLLREQGSGSKKCVETYLNRLGIREEELHVTARLNDQETIKSLVAGGLGISIISEKAAESWAREGRILSFPLPEYGAARKLYLVYRKEFVLKEAAWSFIGFVREFYR